MEIKIILVGMLIGCSYLVGEDISKRYIKRHKQLNDLIRVLEIMRMDLAFGMYTLEEIFRNIAVKDEYDFSEFFLKFADELSKEDGKTIDNILNETIHILYKDTYLKENEIEVKNKVRELEETKESFTRVNLALTTVEKELNEKSKIIENLQLNIVSLSDISKEDKAIKEENSELRKKIKLLEEQLTKNKIEFQRFEYLKSENERYIVEISDLRKEKNEYKVYSNELNNKIQEILLEKANEIAKLNNEKNRVLKESQEKSHRELMEANNIISKLKDELYELKLTLNQWNTK